MVRGLVGVAFHAGEGHAVIAGDDDDGVLQQPAPFKLREHHSEMFVRVLDLVGIVEHVGADGLVVRPVGGDAWDVGELLAAFPDAGLELILAVRLQCAVPEAPGFPVRIVIEEINEVRGVVGGRDAGGLGLELALVIGDAGDEAVSPGRILRHARLPAFAGDADVPAVFHERLRP